MYPVLLAFLEGYLLGSIPAGYIAGRIAGIDIRTAGSGNIGATNVTRVLGKRFGYPVFAFDFLKGLVAVTLAISIGRFAQPSTIPLEIFGIAGAVAGVIGHSFPVWLKFKGGKGVATSAGALFGIMPIAAVIGMLVWLAVFQLTRYVSVASMAAAIVLPIVIVIMTSMSETSTDPLLYFSICLALLVVIRHRSNISRLIRGTEPRFHRK